MDNELPQDDSRPASHPSRRVHSINFEPNADDWLESVVALLREAGFPKSGRSEVVRVALSDLRRTLAHRSRAEIVKFFLDRDAERRLARLDPPDPESL